jgi:integrase
MNVDTVKVEPEIPTEFPYPVTVGNVTVKIFRVKSLKNRAGHYYQVADYSQGPRRLISKADFGKALAEAKRCAKSQKNGDAYALGMDGKERSEYGKAVEVLQHTGASLIQAASSYAEAIRTLQPTGVSLEIAAATLSDCIRILGGQNRCVEACRSFMARESKITETKPVSDAVKEFVTVTESRKAGDKYLKDLRSRLGVKNPKDDVNPKGMAACFQGNIDGITTPQIQSWLDGLHLSPQSYNNYRTIANTFFEFALARGWAAENPVTATKKLKVRSGNVEIFLVEEMTAMLNVADAEFLPVLALCAFAGIRTSEIQRVEWGENGVDLKYKIVKVKTSEAKMGSRRTVDIHDNLAAWLKPYAENTGLVWPHDENALVNRQRATAKRAGKEWRHNAQRHSFSSYRLAEAGRDAGKVAGECGNTPKTLLKHYHELVSPEQAKAWFSIMPAPAPAT